MRKKENKVAIKHEVICDYCGKREDGEEYHYGLPKGWYVLVYHSQSFVAVDDWRITHHFCSKECMLKAIKVESMRATRRR